MQSRTFNQIWFRYSESSWSDGQLVAWQDRGVLAVEDGAVRFQGAKYVLDIRDFVSVTMASQGRDFVNRWVRVDYRDAGEPRVAFFNDGSGLGWGGVLGGTSQLGAAIMEASGLAPVAAAQTPAGWHPDPTGRHSHRYWNGAAWTSDVSDDGVVGTDAL